MKTFVLILSLILNLVLFYMLIHIRRVYHRIMKKNLKEEKTKKILVENVSYVIPDNADEQSRAIIIVLQQLMERDKLYRNPSLTMQDLSKAVGTNKTKLSFVINNYLNHNFASLLNHYRVDEAVHLLSDSHYFNYKISVIGEMCGYSNRQVFHSAFKKIMGITPTHFRNISKSRNP